jgi:hypothetical protein
MVVPVGDALMSASDELFNQIISDPPDYAVIAGDWHRNGMWGTHVITQASKALVTEQKRLILQVGDFGLWEWRGKYTENMSVLLKQYQMWLLFADGNHENHDLLDELHVSEPGPVPVDSAKRIWHLPRGYRWEWHDLKWLAVGGAGSPDAPQRTAGFDWFPQEVITPAQVDEIIAGGLADVILAHDCPRDWLPPLPPPQSWWDMGPCYESAHQLQRITDAVQAHDVIHGHLHVSRDDMVASSHPSGFTHVTGLNMDGRDDNWRVLSTRDMSWQPRVNYRR